MVAIKIGRWGSLPDPAGQNADNRQEAYLFKNGLSLCISVVAGKDAL